MTHQVFRTGALLCAALGATSACATDGYFSHGYGVKTQGMGGAGIALPQDGLAAATNPAGTAAVGDRIDAGVVWFVPKRGAEIAGNGVPGANGHYDGNDKSGFLIPEFAYTKQLSANSAAGIAVYGNGGMNTDYGQNPFRAFGGSGKAGVDFAQVFVSPSYAYRLNAQQTVGAAVNFAYQRFSAYGLDAFAPISSDAAHLTNHGYDSATGWGLRLGWSGQVVSNLTLAATWSSRIKTGAFEQYRGLFAQGGRFDIPANYGLGLAYQPSPGLALAVDVQRIKFGSVKSVGTPLDYLFAGNLLGTANGPGFGWRDITAVKLGASYDVRPDLTVRAGYNHAGQPIPNDQTFFNILAPGVVQDHLTLGATWKTLAGGELSLVYARGLNKTVSGANSIPAPFGGGNANVHLSEQLLGVGYGWKL
jgi:long-chain fatty acid transport protein